jgi:acetyl-CoA carboxylase biotin carboxyl carrier protein
VTGLTDDDIREILRLIDESPLEELHVETQGFSLHVTRARASEPAPPPKPEELDGLVAIEAPMLGTFYRAEAPGEPPFVEVGSRVEPDTTVCIIEVMKMMNSIPAGVAGTIVEICGANAQPVEFGQLLFRVQPA